MKKTGIYIHIPFCGSRCFYCSFCSQTDYGLEQPYFSALKQEILSFKKGQLITADTVYFGGGTPSSVKAEQISEIMKAVRERFTLSENSEITLEANPGTLTEDKLKQYLACGINRFSLGLQSANDKTLRAIGRTHTLQDFKNSVNLLKSHGVKNISADIMLALPKEGEKEVQNTVETLINLDIPHISAYALKVEEHTKLYDSGYRPDEDNAADCYERIYKLLTEDDYRRYEVSNFAKEGFESRHNQKYWDLTPYIAFGVSAHSYYDNKRMSNLSDISAYIDSENKTDEIVKQTAKDREYDYIMLKFRTAEGILFSEYHGLTGLNFSQKYAAAIAKAKDLLTVTDTGICLKPEAFYVMNSVILEFVSLI